MGFAHLRCAHSSMIPTRHTSPVTGVDISIERKLLVSCGYDGRVLMRRLQGKLIWSLQFEQLVNIVRFSPCGSMVAIACADTFAYLVNAEDGRMIGSCGPHGDDVYQLAWDLSSSRIATGCEYRDPAVSIYSCSGALERRLEGHTHAVAGIAFHPHDSNVLATAGEGKRVIVWDLAQGPPRAILEHPRDPECLCWHPDGEVLFTGCDDGGLRLWSGIDFSLHGKHEFSGPLKALKCDLMGEALYVGGYHGTIHCLGYPGLLEQCRFTGHGQWERDFALGETQLATASFRSQPTIYDLQSGEVAAVGVPTFGINCMTHDVDGIRELDNNVEGNEIPDEEAPVRSCHRYLNNRIDCLDYALAKKRGLPIGSGLIESGHKHVLQARLKQSGMARLYKTQRRWPRPAWLKPTDFWTQSGTSPHYAPFLNHTRQHRCEIKNIDAESLDFNTSMVLASLCRRYAAMFVSDFCVAECQYGSIGEFSWRWDWGESVNYGYETS